MNRRDSLDYARRTRKSSTCSTSTLSSSPSSFKRAVTFSLDVTVRTIPAKTDAEISTLWLSEAERRSFRLQANAELKVLKQISKLPRDVRMTDPQVRKLRSSTTVRGLEQAFSKSLFRALVAIQNDHRRAVLEAQDRQRELHGSSNAAMMEAELARISLEKSLTSLERAERQGREDEIAAMDYLMRRSTPTSSSASSASFSSLERCSLSRSNSYSTSGMGIPSVAPYTNAGEVLKRVRPSAELLVRPSSKTSVHSLSKFSGKRCSTPSLSSSGSRNCPAPNATFDTVVLPPSKGHAMITLLEPFPAQPRSRTALNAGDRRSSSVL